MRSPLVCLLEGVFPKGLGKRGTVETPHFDEFPPEEGLGKSGIFPTNRYFDSHKKSPCKKGKKKTVKKAASQPMTKKVGGENSEDDDAWWEF